jgi:hypothetical protein
VGELGVSLGLGLPLAVWPYQWLVKGLWWVETLVHVGQILGCLCDHPALEGTLGPLRIYLTCYHILHANGNLRAGEITSM